MRIAFFAPPKSIDHKTPSGDLMIGKSLHDFLCRQGHEVKIASRMRMRHITNQPQKWPATFIEYKKIIKDLKKFKPDLWLTYHSYYKSPDLFGPRVSKILGVPYVIYQGVFATKYRRDPKTWLGFMSNKKALLHADYVFANKEIDHFNLQRIVIPEKLCRTYPGINPADFKFSAENREELRKKLGLQDCVVVMSTAMLRNDVKAQSVTDLIKAFAQVSKTRPEARLIIAGDGEARDRLEKLAAAEAGDKIIFLGKIKRDQLYRYYSAADLFAFPGINESLGMVYLEAQSCGLPVIAYATRGPREAVEDGKTGLLSPEGDIKVFAENILTVIQDERLRKEMSKAGPDRIIKYFNLNTNMEAVEKQLIETIRRR